MADTPIRRNCAYCDAPVIIRNDRPDKQERLFVFCNDRCEREFRKNMREKRSVKP